MEYLCILKNLNAFEQNYYNRITQIERNSTSETTTPPPPPPPPTPPLSSSATAAPASSANSTTTTSAASALLLSPKQTNMYDPPPTVPTTATASSLLRQSFNVSTPSPTPPPPPLLPQPPPLTPTPPTVLTNALTMSNRKALGDGSMEDGVGARGSFSMMPSLAAAAHQHLQILQRQQQQQQQQQELQQQQQQQNENIHNQQQQQQQQHYQQQFLAHQRQQFHDAVTSSSSSAASTSNFHHHHHHLNQQNDSSVVNSLLWQPWRDLQQAAAIHHQLYQRHQQQLQHKEGRHSSKELPTIKWRRERRQLIAEYRAHDSGTTLNQTDSTMDSPIDMSVSSSSSRYKSSPPPYREPLPGSSCYATTRPSVITQAPRKRDLEDNLMISKREKNDLATESISMCENVIDEHFRRSLGANYAVLFGKKSPTSNNSASSTPSPQPMIGAGLPTYAAAAAAGVASTSTLSTSPTTSSVKYALAAAHQQPQQLYNVNHVVLKQLVETKCVQSKSTSSSPNCCELPPPQDEPLSLHREPTPIPTTPTTPTTPTPTPTQSFSPHNANVELPLAKIDVSQSHPPTPSTVHSVTPTTIMPPAIKSEPGLSDSANTPPSSPSSFSASSDLSNVLASVDDHFAKALGDTWKKLQEHK